MALTSPGRAKGTQGHPKGIQVDAKVDPRGDNGAQKEAKRIEYIFTNSRSTAQAAVMLFIYIYIERERERERDRH